MKVYGALERAQFDSWASDPGSPAIYQFGYDTTNRRLKFWDGFNWRTLLSTKAELPITKVHSGNTPYTVLPSDNYLALNAASGNVSATLSNFSSLSGCKLLTVYRVDESTNTASISISGPPTIDGVDTYYLPPGGYIQLLIHDDGKYYKVAENAGLQKTGSPNSPKAITATGGIAYLPGPKRQIWYIAGSGGPVTVTANPRVAIGPSGTDINGLLAGGEELILYGCHSTNTVQFANGNGLSLPSTRTLGNHSILSLIWTSDGAGGGTWVEQYFKS